MKDHNPAASSPMGKEPPIVASVLNGNAPAFTEAQLRALLAKDSPAADNLKRRLQKLIAARFPR